MKDKETNHIKNETSPSKESPSKDVRHMVIQNIVNSEESYYDIQRSLASASFNLEGHMGEILSIRGKSFTEENDFEIEIEFESLFFLSRARDMEQYKTKITPDESTWGLYGEITDEQREEYRNKLQGFSEYLEIHSSDTEEIHRN